MLVSCNTHFRDKQAEANDYYSRGWTSRRMAHDGLCKLLAKGEAVSVGLFGGKERKEENFEGSYLMGIDLDEGPSVEEFIEYARNDPIGMYAGVVMPTASSTPEHPRTRVFFLLDRKVEGVKEYEALVAKLLHHFRSLKPDTKCGDAARIFFGNSKADGVVKNRVYLPVSLLQSLPEPTKEATKEVSPNAEKTGIATDIGTLFTKTAEKGTRNNTAMTLVGYFVNHHSPEVVTDIMRGWWQTRVRDKGDFPFSLVESMVSRMDAKSKESRDRVQKLTKASVPSVRIVPLTEFMEREEPVIKWAVSGWLPEATTALMVGAPGTYKTWIGLAMALSLASGTPLFGNPEYTVGRRYPALVVQQEDSKSILRQRVDTILSTVNPEYRQSGSLPMYLWEGDTLKFDDVSAMELLETTIKENGIEFVLIDPLYASANSEDYMAKASQHMTKLKRLRDVYGCSFLVIHHTRKTASQDGVDRQDAWGSQFINAWLETGIQIRKREDGSLVIKRHSKFSDKDELCSLKMDISSETPKRFSASLATIQGDSDGGWDTRILELFKTKESLTGSQIAAALGKSPSWVSDGVGKGVLTRLVKAEVLVKTRKGNSSVYCLSAPVNF